MARSKKESAKNIRDRMIRNQAIDVSEQASKNIEVAKNIAAVSVSIERLSDDQADIFERILSTLEEIPSSIRERERQSDKIANQIADAIVRLEKQLEEETDENKRSQLQGAIGQLKTQGESAVSGIPNRQRGLSLLEGAGKKFLGLQRQDIENMRSRGGGVRGLFGAYGSGLKREFKQIIGRGDSPRSFEKRLTEARIKESASSEISRALPDARRDRVRESVENVADYNIAQRDPETGNFFRTSKAGDRIDEFTASGKINPQFDPAGLVQKRDDLISSAQTSAGATTALAAASVSSDKVEDILNEIARSTETTANLLQEAAREKDKPVDTAGAGSDYDPTKDAPVVEASSEGPGLGLVDSALDLLGGAASLLPGRNRSRNRNRNRTRTRAPNRGGRFSRMFRGGGAARGATRLAGRALGPLAAGLSIYEGYQGVSAANEAYEAGDITKNERDAQRGEAVGGAAGGLGGAAAGAAMGATIGSVVPVVGTAIGGLLGGALGYMGGNKLGGLFGRKAGETLSGDDPAETAADALSQMSEAVEEQRRMNNANELEQQAMNGSENLPVVNNVDNSQRVVNNYAGGSGGQSGSTTSISVRNDESSWLRFQDRRLSRVM